MQSGESDPLRRAVRSAGARLPRVLLVLALATACSCGQDGGAGAPDTLERALAADWEDLSYELVTALPEEREGGLAVVFLHGYGSRGSDYASLAHELAGRDARVFLPDAVLSHREGRGFLWWEFFDDDWPKPYSASPSANAWPKPSRQLPKAREAVTRLLARIRARYRPNVLVLAGHSQGAMLALDVGASLDPPVDALTLVAGYLLLDSVPAVTRPRAQRPRVLIVHGRRDPVIGFERAELMREVLERSGYPVGFRPHDGGHGVEPPVGRELRAFLRPGSD